MLGYFDEDLHKQWLDESETEARKLNANGDVERVAHMYTRGDLCSDANTLRFVTLSTSG